MSNAELFRRAHRLARHHHVKGEDYRATFAAALKHCRRPMVPPPPVRTRGAASYADVPAPMHRGGRDVWGRRVRA